MNKSPRAEKEAKALYAKRAKRKSVIFLLLYHLLECNLLPTILQEKVSFYFASEASYVYILRIQKFIKNA